jgi:hypothetical protein
MNDDELVLQFIANMLDCFRSLSYKNLPSFDVSLAFD